MSARHREDECVSVDGDDVPWAREALRLRRLVPFFVKALLTSANDSEYFFSRQVDLSDCVILRVAQVDEVLVLAEHMAEPLRMMELSFVVGPIDEANLAVSDLVLELHRLLVDHD